MLCVSSTPSLPPFLSLHSQKHTLLSPAKRLSLRTITAHNVSNNNKTSLSLSLLLTSSFLPPSTHTTKIPSNVIPLPLSSLPPSLPLYLTPNPLSCPRGRGRPSIKVLCQILDKLPLGIIHDSSINGYRRTFQYRPRGKTKQQWQLP